MRIRGIVTVAVATALTLAGAVVDKNEQALRVAISKYVGALRHKNASAALAMTTSDFTMGGQGRPSIKGRDPKTGLAPYLKSIKSVDRLDFQISKITIHGDKATVGTKSTMAMTYVAAGIDRHVKTSAVSTQSWVLKPTGWRLRSIFTNQARSSLDAVKAEK